MIHNKLVRDKIPEILKEKNLSPKVHIADDSEYWDSLKEKLKEEVREFLEDNSIEELADVQEVVDSIRKFKGFTDLESVKSKKAQERGSFDKKYILEEV